MQKKNAKKFKNAVQSNKICRYFKIIEQFFLNILKSCAFLGPPKCFRTIGETLG